MSDRYVMRHFPGSWFAWLLDAQGLAELLELAGYDAAPVVRRVRELLTHEHERSRG